jgi:hypothetical protein
MQWLGHGAENPKLTFKLPAIDTVIPTMPGARGFTASQSALEGRGGYFESFVQKWTLEPFADLGRRYDLAETGYTGSSLLRSIIKALPHPRGRGQ